MTTGTAVEPSPLEGTVSHPFGRLLTAEEVLSCIAATGDSFCSACGDEWTMHRVRCSGSADG